VSFFIAAVKKLYGSGAGTRLSAKGWLDESDLMDSPPRSKGGNWHAITIAALARLASRVNAGAHHGITQPIDN
jgi:hypothetical protein